MCVATAKMTNEDQMEKFKAESFRATRGHIVAHFSVVGDDSFEGTIEHQKEWVTEIYDELGTGQPQIPGTTVVAIHDPFVLCY